ncbi:trace amine-associated receptor 13c-like [Symphorus nematophorus]
METMEGSELCFPQLLNASCIKPTRPYFETMLIYILLSAIAVITTALNLLVVISISHFKQLHTPTNFLILSLAVSDFLVGLLMVFQVILIDGCWFLGDLMCTVYQYLAYIIASASVGTMVLISIDRYVAICHPLHYLTKVTQKRVEVCVCLCWICSVIFQNLVLSDILEQPGSYNSCIGECVFFINYNAGIADLVFSFIVPIAVIVVLYMRIFVVAVSQARAMRSHVAAVTLQQSVKVTAKKSEMKAARTLGVVVVLFLICLCPYYCVALTGQDSVLNASTSGFVLCLYYFNSCLNPVIYAFFYPWFRKSVKLIVTLKILQPDSSDANIQGKVSSQVSQTTLKSVSIQQVDQKGGIEPTSYSGATFCEAFQKETWLWPAFQLLSIPQPELPRTVEVLLPSTIEVLLPRDLAGVPPASGLADGKFVPESAYGSPASESVAQPISVHGSFCLPLLLMSRVAQASPPAYRVYRPPEEFHLRNNFLK